MANQISFVQAGLLSIALAACPATAFASEVVVPDDFATIAQAIASGADTVSVRPGTYAESVGVTRTLVLRGLCAGGSWGTECPLSDRPILSSVTTAGATVRFQYIHVTGPASISGYYGDTAVVRGCRFDAGFTQFSDSPCQFLSCQVFGDLSIRGGFSADVGLNTVTGGTLSVGNGGQGLKLVHDNTVFGPASVGIEVGDDCVVERNFVHGCAIGMVPTSDENSYYFGNVVEDCSGTGYYWGDPHGWGATLRKNVARRCGGRGFDLACSWSVFDGNEADSTGQEGVLLHQYVDRLVDNSAKHTGGVGIRAGAVDGHPGFRVKIVSGNRVFEAGADGLVIGWSDSISNNVVGRSNGSGIVVRNIPSNGYRFHHNTVYANGGAGIDLVGGSSSELDSISNNIAVGNAVGLRWTIDPGLPAWLSPAIPLLACNDWFGNLTGSVTGTPLSAADTTLNPLFCDLTHDDVSLSSASPLANLPGCDQVGALGVGCSYPASVVAGAAPPPARLLVAPQPGRGPIQFSWKPGAGPARLDIYDVTGARRWSSSVARDQNASMWSGGGSDGRMLPAGVYFARLSQSGSRSEARVVVLQ